jgi:hypothetical protein
MMRIIGIVLAFELSIHEYISAMIGHLLEDFIQGSKDV